MLAPFPTNTRQQIEEILSYDSRLVSIVVLEDETPCPLCSLDPITNTSTDSFCPSCSGEYWIPVYSGVAISGHVTWGEMENRAWETGGMLDNGKGQVKFLHTAELEEVIHSSQYLVVDNRIVDIKNVILRGIPDINRIIVVFKERER